jgi:hypothetical protein
MQMHFTLIKAIAIKLTQRVLEDAAWRSAVTTSVEPYRCLVDLGREAKLHSIPDGSLDYEFLVDSLEHAEAWINSPTN